MKKCPVCKAEIPENARFCIHCMTAFTEKENIQPPAREKRRWPFVLVCLLMLVLLVGLLILLTPPDPAQPTETTQAPSESTQSAPSTEQTPGQSQTTALPPETTLPPETKPQHQSVFTYRAANGGDDPYGTVDPSRDIVITGVAIPAADGVYHVPSYIDGKRVIAIGYIAFSGTDARSVTLGETVRCIGQNAFLGCNHIHSVYLQADAVFLSPSAFTDASRRNCALTIYGSSACTERQTGQLLKDLVTSRYGATYQEWNG